MGDCMAFGCSEKVRFDNVPGGFRMINPHFHRRGLKSEKGMRYNAQRARIREHTVTHAPGFEPMMQHRGSLFRRFSGFSRRKNRVKLMRIEIRGAACGAFCFIGGFL